MGSDARTLWVGNLPDKVDEDLLYELFIQAGPLENINVKKGPSNGGQNPFAFVTFRHDVSVGYAIALFEGISLYGRILNMKQRHGVTPDYKYRDIMESYLQETHHQRGRQQLQSQQPIMNYVGQTEAYDVPQYAMAQQQMMMMMMKQQQQQQHYEGGRGSSSGGDGGVNRGGFRRDQRDVGQPRDNSRNRHGHNSGGNSGGNSSSSSHDRHERGGSSRRSQHHHHHHSGGTKHHHHHSR